MPATEQNTLEMPYDLFLELRAGPGPETAPLTSRAVTGDVAELVEECFVRGVLADKIPAEFDAVAAEIEMVWMREPFVEQLEVAVVAHHAGGASRYAQRFAAGRWARTADEDRQKLVEDGLLPEGATAYRTLAAARRHRPVEIRLGALEAPPLRDGTLEEVGVRDLGRGELAPDRPVLCNGRMVADILEQTERAAAHETGGAVLGKMIRLAEPLAGTQTRIVTILTAALTDDRHVGSVGTFQFSPEALAEAKQIAGLRGAEESILTAWHSHGWGTACGKCNQSDGCVLPQVTLVSPADYQVLESLFPSKATLMPIAGRKLGEDSKRPVMVVHAWRGGQMRPLAWRTFAD
jgi:hypothetical protein